MNNFLKGSLLVLLLMIGLFACQKDEINKVEQAKYMDTEHNQKLSQLAISVNKAISNKSFRNLIKDEAQKKFDGDFDILIKDIVNKPVENHLKNKFSGKENVTVKELLEEYFPDSYKKKFKSGSSIIDDLVKRYPDLQISVPVHNEEWDPDNYIPVVSFIPEEYEDQTIKSIPAFNNNDEEISIDAVNEPSEPVIVIGHNERMMIIEPDDTPPPTPSNLTGICTEAGIRLNWNMPSNADHANTWGYYVYRKSSSNTSYQLKSIVNGVNNRFFDDNSVVAGAVYSYYVMAYRDNLKSPASNYITVTAPLMPNPVLSFDAIQHSLNEIELRWENDNSQYISYTQLSRHIVNVNSGYVPLKQFTPNQHDYFDHDISLGKKNIYKINHVTPTGTSNPKYDFVNIPYRDISKKSPVYIKEMFVSDVKGVEEWWRGAPEFYVTVANVSGDKTPYMIQEKLDFQFDHRTTYHVINGGSKILDWQPGFWYDMITFHVIEYNRGEVKINLGVGYNKKNIAKTGFEAQGGVNFVYEAPKYKNCGTYFFDYFDYPDQWLEFPNYGFKILVGRTGN